ncbi:hypothetical protein D3C72_2048670 [compost metagenome]
MHPFTREYTKCASGGHPFFDSLRFLPHEVGQLHQENLVRVQVFNGVQRGLRGKHVIGIQSQAEIRTVGAADYIPGRGKFVDGAPPGQALESDLDTQRQRQHGQLAQIARNGVQILRGMPQRR